MGCRTTPQADSGSVQAKPVSWADTDADGIPDLAELHSFEDRQNFCRWFAAIAEMQFYELSRAWNEEQQDCAGLVRFAWREALRRHNGLWFQKMGAAYEAIAPDVRSGALEEWPVKEGFFRVRSGAFQKNDLWYGGFSEFADAQTLKNFNSVFVTFNRRHAHAGDLLFYHQPWVQKYPFHVMIFIGKSQISDEAGDDWIVYHTGGSAPDEGIVKKVRLNVLDHHPNPRWRPVENNPNFLGFYRLKILL